MILYEYEGKELLKGAGIAVPKSVLVDKDSNFEIATLASLARNDGVVLKAQVLSGKRADQGGIVVINQSSNIKDQIDQMFGKPINGEKVEKVLVEELIDKGSEYYLSISYDTDTRAPVLSLSESGGTGIEERKVKTFKIDPIKQTVTLSPEGVLNKVKGINSEHIFFALAQNDIINKLVKLFFEADCLLLEINPIVKAGDKWIALDAKVKLDDSALGRHKEWDFPPRSAPGHTPTKREIEAKRIDEDDYRGVAGSAFFDLSGDIAVMASGGGASLTALDALINLGGKPANYTEYGGNPPREKVFKLTQIVLEKEDLHGLWVVGALANFTDIYETLSGFIEGLREAEKSLGRKIDFPIVIRRAGPRDDEARKMLSEVKDFDLHLYGEETSITESARIILEKAKEYAATH